MPHIILKSSLDHLSFLDSRDEKPIFNPETLSVTYTPPWGRHPQDEDLRDLALRKQERRTPDSKKERGRVFPFVSRPSDRPRSHPSSPGYSARPFDR